MDPSSESPENDLSAKPFLEHLEELRQTLIRCALAFGICFLVALPLSPFFLSVLKKPLMELPQTLGEGLPSMQVAGAFAVTMRLGFWFGLILSAPLLVFFAGHFVAPGLTVREKQVVLRSMGFAVVLFLLGVTLGYTITLPVAVRMMWKWHEWLGIRPLWTINSYVAFSSQLLIGFGLAFELPVVVLVLGRLNLLNAARLREKRRYVVVGLLVLAMILTPPDVFTQMIMAVPLILLYELCIWLLWMSERRALHENG
jgi:sec-independent protein translocase protein TatC